MLFTNLGLWSWLAPLVALPLLIHWLNRRHPRVIQFSSVQEIKRSLAQRSRLFRWRHLILALLRTAALLLLLLAFLRPVQMLFGAKKRETGPRHVVVLFDHSLSMGYRESSLSGHKRAVQEFEKIVSTLAAEDMLNVHLVGREAPAYFNEFSTDHSGALKYIRGIEPGLGRADFNKANAAVTQALQNAPGRQEVYYISDFQRASWSSVDLSRIPESARLFFVNVAPNPRPNRALLGAKLERDTLEVTLGNFADAPWRGEVEVIVDGKRGAKADASANAWSTGKVSVTLPLGGAGLHTIEARLATDDLPQDDRYFLATYTADQEEIVVVTDETGGKQQSAGFFLTKALNPYGNRTGALLPKPTNSGALTPMRLATAEKMFLTTLDKLSPETCQLLAKWVKDGGSMVYFSDGKFDGENLRALEQAAGGSFAPLLLNGRQETANLAGGSQQILQGEWKSKYLRIFQGTQRQSLALLEFYEYYHGTATPNGSVLLRFADGSPALAVAHPSLGTFLLCNFSVNELASNMARQRAFPAWIQDLVKTLDSEEAPDKPQEAGDEIHTEIWEGELANAAVTAPDGKPVRTTRELDGNRYRLSFVAPQSGFYRLQEGADARAFAVDVPADEADLRSLDLSLLPQRAGEGGRAHFVDGRGDFAALNTGRPLFHYFVLGVLGLLLAELAAQILFRRVKRVS